MPDGKSYLQNIGLQTCLMVSLTLKTQTYNIRDDKSYLQNMGLQTCLMVSVTNKTQTYMSDSRAGFPFCKDVLLSLPALIVKMKAIWTFARTAET